MQFMDANDLQVKDLDFADIEFMYESDDGMRRSWLDHVLVSSNVLHRIQKIYIIIILVYDNQRRAELSLATVVIL